MKRRQLLAHGARALQASAALGGLALLQACSKKEDEGASTAAASKTDDAGKPAALTPEQAFDLAATGTGFTIGPVMAANTVYVFFDSQCPHCAALWQTSQQVGGRFRMQWMPVAFLAKISQTQGAAILTAQDPPALMSQNEALVMERKGGLDISKLSPPQEAQDKVLANTELLKKLGADSVPMIYFKNARTGQAGSHSGSLPLDALLQLVGAN